MTFNRQCYQLTEDSFEMNLTQDRYKRCLRALHPVHPWVLDIATNNVHPSLNQIQTAKPFRTWPIDACQNAINKRSKWGPLANASYDRSCLQTMQRNRAKRHQKSEKGELAKLLWNIKHSNKNEWNLTDNKTDEWSKNAHNIPTSKYGDKKYESNHEKAELFAETFARVSADENIIFTRQTSSEIEQNSILNPQRQPHPTLIYSTKTSFITNYARQIHQYRRNSSPGQDTTSYEILKEIAKSGLQVLLKILNHTWAKGKIPAEWKHALVTPILKPTKPNNDHTSYRPISLTSSICKIMEKLVSNRLGWYLEHN